MLTDKHHRYFLDSSSCITFSCLALHQTLRDELRAAALQCCGVTLSHGVRRLVHHLGGEQSQAGKQEPGIVVDVRLDEPVPIADADGHHGVDCDTVGGEMTAEKHRRNGYV